MLKQEHKIGFLLGCIVGAIVFTNAAFFICRNYDLNWFNDSTDTHAIQVSTKTENTVRTSQIELPPVEVDAIHGQVLSDSENQEVSRRHSHISQPKKGKNPSVRLKAEMTSSGPDALDAILATPAIGINPHSDRFIRIEFTRDVPLLTNVVLPDCTFTHRQIVKYHFYWLNSPDGMQSVDFKFTPSPIEAVVVDRHTTTTVFKRTWLRVSPFAGVNALNTAEWFAGINLAIRYGDFWVKGGTELPMRKDPKLNVPVSLEYDLITFER